MVLINQIINNYSFSEILFNFSDSLYLKIDDNNYYINKSIIIGLLFIISIYLKKTRRINDINYFKNRNFIYDSYLDKGEDELKLLNNKELSPEEKDNLKCKFFQEVTPEGLVKLYYDHNFESFIYYSDNQISYKYLEVVARLFVIQNNCKIIFIDFKDQLFKAKQNKQNKLNKQVEKKNKSLFALKKNKKLSEYSSIYLIPEISNKYIKKGTIKDLEEIFRLENEKEKNKKNIRNINFKNYKNKN